MAGCAEAQPATINPLQRQRLLEPAPPPTRRPAGGERFGLVASDWVEPVGPTTPG